MASLDAKNVRAQELRELSRLRPALWLGDLALNWGIIASTIVAYGALDSLWVLPLASLIIGARQHALGLLGHDAAHRCAFKNRRLNSFFGELFAAWPLFVTLEHGYRPWHFEHHRSLGTDSDPELRYRRLHPYEPPITPTKVVLWFFLDMAGLGILDLFRFLRETFPRRLWQHWGPVSLYGLWFIVCSWFAYRWIFYLWVGSLLTGFWAVFRVRTWYEHVGLELAGKEGTHRFRASPLLRFLFFPHNTHCHYEHHRWASVPYYNLPKLRSYVGGRPVLSSLEVLLRFPQCDGLVGSPQEKVPEGFRESEVSDT